MAHQRTKVTQKQLGHILFSFAQDRAGKLFCDQNSLRSLELIGSEKDRLFKELLLVNMFLIVQSTQDFFSDQATETKVLDEMLAAYLKTALQSGTSSIDDADFKTEMTSVVARYREYDEAMEAKMGPNWLWPLSRRILNNLHQKEVIDPVGALTIANIITSIIEQIGEHFADKYEVAE